MDFESGTNKQFRPRAGGRVRLPIIPVREKMLFCCCVMGTVTCLVFFYLVFFRATPAQLILDTDFSKFVNHKAESIREATLVNMFRYDVEHTGQAPSDATAAGTYTLMWVTERLNREKYGASKSSPAVDKDVVYIGTDWATLLAFYRVNGTLKWTHQCYNHKKGIHGSPAFDETNVYIGTYTGHLYAVDKQTGARVWSNRICGSIGASPVLWKGAVFIGAEFWDNREHHGRGKVIGVNKETGKEVFSSKMLPHFAHSTPSIDTEMGYAYMGDNSAHTYAWDINEPFKASLQEHFEDVEAKWTFSMLPKGDMKGTPTVYEHMVYVACWDHHIYALNKHSGDVVWKFNMGAKSMSSASVDPARSLVVIGCHSGSVFGLDMYTGSYKWQVRTGGRVMSSASILSHEDIGIIGSWDKYIYVIKLSTGDVLQKLGLISGLTGQPTVSGDWLYAFDHLGYLYAFQNSGRNNKIS